MGRFLFLTWGGILLLSLLTACAGPGERVPVSLSSKEKPPPSTQLKPGKWIVFPLADAHPEPKQVGRRIHLFGQIDTYEPTSSLGERIAQLLVISLRRRGYDALMASPTAHPGEVTGERVLTGTIRTFWIDATSHFGYTQMQANARMNIEIRDIKTGAKTAVRIEGENAPKVVFFSRDVLEETLSELISDGMKQVLP